MKHLFVLFGMLGGIGLVALPALGEPGRSAAIEHDHESHDQASLAACRLEAEGGHVEAQYILARLYLDGRKVAQDFNEAWFWAKKAADQGHARSQFVIGHMLAEGKGVAKNEAEAVSWFHQAAAQGNIQAQYVLGQFYWFGRGVPRDYGKAADWYRQAAVQEHPGAQSNLGHMYAEGLGVEKDVKEAARWYRRSADQGHAWGQTNMGEICLKGQGVAKNPVEALMWFQLASGKQIEIADRGAKELRQSLSPEQIQEAERLAQAWLKEFPLRYPTPKELEELKRLEAAAQDGRAEQFILIGILYESGKGAPKSLTEARKWFQRAVDKGNPSGMALLAKSYLKHNATSAQIQAAVGLLTKAAGLGDWEAPVHLGNLYAEGKVDSINHDEALKWYRMGAERMEPQAAFKLARMLELGDGVKQDVAQARRWYEQSAQLWYGDAQYRLGIFLEQGLGGQPDKVEALKWYRLAARQKVRGAEDAANKLEGRLSSQEIERAATLEAEWFKGEATLWLVP